MKNIVAGLLLLMTASPALSSTCDVTSSLVPTYMDWNATFNSRKAAYSFNLAAPGSNVFNLTIDYTDHTTVELTPVVTINPQTFLEGVVVNFSVGKIDGGSTIAGSPDPGSNGYTVAWSKFDAVHTVKSTPVQFTGLTNTTDTFVIEVIYTIVDTNVDLAKLIDQSELDDIVNISFEGRCLS